MRFPYPATAARIRPARTVVLNLIVFADGNVVSFRRDPRFGARVDVIPEARMRAPEYCPLGTRLSNRPRSSRRAIAREAAIAAAPRGALRLAPTADHFH